MTLHTTMDTDNSHDLRVGKTFGHLLLFCLKRAIRKDRLHCGMTSCAQLFKTDPASVMMCVLPSSSDQLGVRINHTLIKAFCQERNIPVIPIQDGGHRFTSFIKRVSAKGKQWKRKSGGLEDMSCVVIQQDSKGMGKYDSELIQLYNQTMANGTALPLVELPS